MRTNIDIDDLLIKQAARLSDKKTKKDIVNEALKEYIAILKKQELLSLKGQISWEGNLEEMRSL